MNKFNPNDLGKMMKEAQKIQNDLMKMQEKLGDETVEGSAGGGAVTVVVTGKHAAKSIKISKDAVDPEDVETLEDLVLAAFNDAVTKANKLAEEKMNQATGGLMGKLPGMPGMF